MASFFSRISSAITTYTGYEGYKFGDVTRATAGRMGAAVLKYTGREDYNLGDISRTTVDKYYEWKHAYGTPALEGLRSGVLNYTAKDHYALGDITLATVRHFINMLKYTSNQLKNSPSSEEIISNQPPDDIDNLIQVFSQAFWSPNIPEVKIQKPIAVIPNEVIWDSFWERSYELSMQCLKLGILVVDDFLNLESFLFIGLPSLVLIEAVHRSIEQEGILLATGLLVTKSNCPKEFAELYNVVETFKTQFFSFEFDNLELCWLKLNLLFASCDKAPPQEISTRLSEDRIVMINSIKSKVSQVAIGITQMSIFKKKFGGVISRVLEELSETDES